MMVIVLLGQHLHFIRCAVQPWREMKERRNVKGSASVGKSTAKDTEHKLEYVMHSTNTTARTVACAVIVAVLSLVLSLGRMLKAVVIIRDFRAC